MWCVFQAGVSGRFPSPPNPASLSTGYANLTPTRTVITPGTQEGRVRSGGIIKGSIIDFEGKSYHPEHFKCTICSKPVREFLQHDGKGSTALRLTEPGWALEDALAWGGTDSPARFACA